MPTCTGEAAGVTELMSQAPSFLLLLAADDGNLVTEFTSFFCQGMDVKAGRFRLYGIWPLAFITSYIHKGIGTHAACKKRELLDQITHLRWVHVLVSKNDYTTFRD